MRERENDDDECVRFWGLMGCGEVMMVEVVQCFLYLFGVRGNESFWICGREG